MRIAGGVTGTGRQSLHGHDAPAGRQTSLGRGCKPARARVVRAHARDEVAARIALIRTRLLSKARARRRFSLVPQRLNGTGDSRVTPWLVGSSSLDAPHSSPSAAARRSHLFRLHQSLSLCVCVCVEMRPLSFKRLKFSGRRGHQVNEALIP